MFDAWTGERVSDGLKWEESMVSIVYSTVPSGVEGHRLKQKLFPFS